MPKSSIVGLWRLFAMRKARIWRAFLTKERIFSENENSVADLGGFELEHSQSGNAL
jgi:hypothetical protein